MNPIQQIIDSVDDALVRIKQDLKLDILGEDMLQVYSWHQTWSSTSCGFGGVAGQAITTAQTVVIMYEGNGAYVYHHGRFAYKLHLDDRRTKDFANKFLVDQTFPGLYDIMNSDVYRFISYDLPQIK